MPCRSFLSSVFKNPGVKDPARWLRVKGCQSPRCGQGRRGQRRVLFVATELGQTECVKALLAAGADKDAAGNDGRSSSLPSWGRPSAKALLAAGADKDGRGQ